jgi:ABC-type uncharacterized transport system involved in gliding motility auxiliary subunit
MKPGPKTVAVLALFAGLVLVNYLASKLPVRGDATAGRIYTLSDGTHALLSKIEEPITLDFYFSRRASGLPVNYKNFASRVEEMLRQYTRAAGGRLTLNVINPEPDTPEEERATSAGIRPQMIPTTGEQIYFGLVATQADQQEALTAFNPQRESFLEYDLSQLIYSVQQFDRRKLGLITSLPLQAPPFNPMMMMQGGQPPQGQMVTTEWEKSFELVPVEASATELPDNLDALAVVHPQGLTPRLTYAIDQFLLSGKPVFIAVDPASQHFRRQGGQMAMMGMGGGANVSSDLPDLFRAYGVSYDPQSVVGDLENATQVQTGAGVARFPVWLSLRRDALSADAMPTAQLQSLLFVEPGAFTVSADAGLEVTPLVHSSERSGTVSAASLQFAQPDDVARQITPSGRKTLAALVRGTFKTAFPDGPPAETPPAPAAGENAPAPAPQPADGPSLKESSGTSTLILVADTDWLFDDYSVRRLNFLGVQAAEPLNDNLAFGSNALEFLAGSQDLISLRGKGTSLRPFDVVRDIEVRAQERYQQELVALEARLSEVQNRLSELQRSSGEGNRLVASPEVAQAIEEFQQQEVAMRRERREIRRALREDIDALENRLLIANLLATPVLVGAFGLWFHRRRTR